MDVLDLLGLALSLSMDAFAVSICKGLAFKNIKTNAPIVFGFWFGGFQILMPLLGYMLGTHFEYLARRYAPIIAFILLFIIGLKMINDSFKSSNIIIDTSQNLNVSAMLPLAIATSIDAFVVGITFAFLPINIINASLLINTILGVLFIGLTTFTLSYFGFGIGNIFGAKFKSKASLIGGIVLILIGLKILLFK